MAGQLDPDWSSKQGSGRSDTSSTMKSCSIVSQELVHRLLPVRSCTEHLAKCFHEAFHFAICLWSHRSNSIVLETKIICKLGKLVTIKRRTVIRLNNLRHTISGKYAIQVRKDRFRRGRMHNLNFRKS